MFKNLKNLFVEVVEEEEDKKQPTRKEKSTPKPKKESKPVTNRPTTEPIRTTTVTEGVVDDKFMGILLSAMEKNNLQGFDYLEFKQSLQGLQKMPMDEATRYKSAFVMASSMGVSQDSLVKTANHYLNVLAKEEKKFENALTQQSNSRIGQQKQEVVAMEKAVQEKAAQIKRLTEEIAKIQEQVGQKRKMIGEASAKIEQTKNNFIASYNAIRGQIEADVENIKRYITG